MNRQKKPSRGNLSPIELTTGITPRTAASVIHRYGGVVDVLDSDATLTFQQTVQGLAQMINDGGNVRHR